MLPNLRKRNSWVNPGQSHSTERWPFGNANRFNYLSNPSKMSAMINATEVYPSFGFQQAAGAG